jgi:membrane glycosyltransferase
MIVAVLWGIILFLVNRSFFWWNMPVFVPIILSAPLSVWSSRAGIGQAFRTRGLFIIPEEIEPPQELHCLNTILQQQHAAQRLLHIPPEAGFISAVVDPQVNWLHRSLLRTERKVAPSIAVHRNELQDKAIMQGPNSLSTREKKEILYDPRCMRELHERVWELTDSSQAAPWGLAA